LAFSFRSRAFSFNFSLVTDRKQYTFVRDTAFYSHVDISLEFYTFSESFLIITRERETMCLLSNLSALTCDLISMR